LATNIGIHFFDMLLGIFGRPEHTEVHLAEPTRTAGYLELERARVRWFLSIDHQDLPSGYTPGGKSTYRSICVDGKELEFSDGFTDLHTLVYREILAGKGFGPEDARASITLAYNIRNAKPTGICEVSHPLLRKK
jgi:UDP-N-acetyl-2-amino-2-deoxyglucuronate dehydrogenase